MTHAATVSQRTGGLDSWLRLARVSNAPTVMSSAMVGAAIGSAHGLDVLPPMVPMVLTAIGCTLLYMCGMVMNDYFDQPLDRRERPLRPLVSGSISENAALMFAMILLASGITLLTLASAASIPWSLLLVSCMLAYNLLHRSAVIGPLLMAACRALVPTIAAIACAPDQHPDWNIIGFFALPLAAYTAAISITARHEMLQTPETDSTHSVRIATAAAVASVCALLPFGAIAFHVVRMPQAGSITTYVCCILVANWMLLRGIRWMVLPRGVPRGVMKWIAAICVIDAGSLLLLSQPLLAGVAALAAVMTVGMQRRIMGS